MSSDDMTITYTAIKKRALNDAKERMPELPKENTEHAWEQFIRDLEDIDSMEIAIESSEWDWVIYYHRALELCQAVPSSVLNAAEENMHDMRGPDMGLGESLGLYELACHIATEIVVEEIRGAVETVREELLDMANNQLENM